MGGELKLYQYLSEKGTISAASLYEPIKKTTVIDGRLFCLKLTGIAGLVGCV